MAVERIELRRGSDTGPDVRIVADIDAAQAKFEIKVGQTTTERSIPFAQFAPLARRLEDAVVPAVAMTVTPTIATGYELAITTGLSQSVFRWVSATPPGWEPLHDAVEDLLRLAGVD